MVDPDRLSGGAGFYVAQDGVFGRPVDVFKMPGHHAQFKPIHSLFVKSEDAFSRCGGGRCEVSVKLRFSEVEIELSVALMPSGVNAVGSKGFELGVGFEADFGNDLRCPENCLLQEVEQDFASFSGPALVPKEAAGFPAEFEDICIRASLVSFLDGEAVGQNVVGQIFGQILPSWAAVRIELQMVKPRGRYKAVQRRRVRKRIEAGGVAIREYLQVLL